VQSVGFTVEHGCDGSATVQLDVRLPEGVSGVVPEPPAGWTSGVDGRVVTFSGGPLPDDVEGTFRVRMALPATPGATIYFPFVQRCEQGRPTGFNSVAAAPETNRHERCGSPNR
jgi:periplasmic copper chaperone A